MAYLQGLNFFDCTLLALQLELQSANLLLLGLQMHYM